MEPQINGTDILKAFEQLPDPRTRTCPHRWDELMFVALCGLASGADSWVSVADWAALKLEWLRRYLPFVNGIASHDTFSRVFNLLDAQSFEACFVGWMQALCPALAGELIPIDGKSVRRSHNGADPMAHLVSAWHSTRGLVLGQVKTALKSNEITAIPELLDALDIQGATITIDAMGCQHAIVEKIVEKKADYIIAVKDNQPLLAKAIESLFDAHDAGLLAPVLSSDTSLDKGHGRVETRRCVVADDLQVLGKHGPAWCGLQSVVRVECTREIVNGKGKGQSSTERRYYISSLRLSASECNAAVRSHWGIENSCHWVLDMAFREDDCRIRTGDGAENFAILRRIVLNLLKREKSGKSSVNIKRLRAGWSTKYLETLLGLQPIEPLGFMQ
jgi:predicted transposase YbfD/YdcC